MLIQLFHHEHLAEQYALGLLELMSVSNGLGSVKSLTHQESHERTDERRTWREFSRMRRRKALMVMSQA